MVHHAGSYGNGRGYFCFTGPEGVKEADSFTCQHCNRVTIVKPMQDPADVGGLCKCCMGLICPRCTRLAAAGQPCVPLEERLRRQEAADIARRSYGI